MRFGDTAKLILCMGLWAEWHCDMIYLEYFVLPMLITCLLLCVQTGLHTQHSCVLCVLFGSQNKQRLFTYAPLDD
jgi:hypothetical protein